MKHRLGFVMCHGWGLDTSSLNGLKTLLQRQWPDACMVDHSLNAEPLTLSQGTQWVGIGHSMGFASLAHHKAVHGQAWSGLISLHGFRWFCRQGGLPGTPPRVLQAMIERMHTEPSPTWLDFLNRCGATPSFADEQARRINLDSASTHQQLINHLLALKQLAPVTTHTPVLALASHHDPIVPANLTEQSFNADQLVWIEQANNHLSPCLHPEYYLPAIVQFVDHIAVAQRFSLAAETYDSAASVQAQSAQALVAQAHMQFQDLHKMASPQLIDIGCGTGAVYRGLRQTYPSSHITLMDIAPGMIDHCQQRYRNDAHIEFVIGDAQQPNPRLGHTADVTGHTATSSRRRYDLALSNMCFQWFDDLSQTVLQWLALTQRLAITVLLDSSFAPWKAAHLEHGEHCGLRHLPTLDHIHTLHAHLQRSGYAVRLQLNTLYQTDANGLAFARSLKHIGADTPNPEHKPAALRKILKSLPAPLVNNYDIAVLMIEHQA